MGANTPKLQLYKADPTEFALVDTDINNNYDRIDANLPTVVCTSSTRPPTPFTGMLIYETNTLAIRIWTGTTWKAQGMILCTSTTRPANPSIGDQIYESDTNRVLVRTADGKWTTVLVTYSQTSYLNGVNTNIPQQGAAATAGRMLQVPGVVCDGNTKMRMSAFWPAIRTSAGTATAADSIFVELGYGDGASIQSTTQRTYTGGGSNNSNNQNGGVISADLTPVAGTWTFYLRMVEYAGSIATFILQTTDVGIASFTLEERPGSKY